jgi:orotate phosphoribosyltransferase
MSGAGSAINLIPSGESVLDILRKTGAFREGHFVYPNGKHASYYFQMPLAFRYYDNARILSVGLSRMFRVIKGISSKLPKVAIVSPSPGGIPVAFGVREALEAEQIYWAEIENGQRQFRQYIQKGDVYPSIIVDDVLRSGKALAETVKLLNDLGSEVIGIGSILRFEDAPTEIEGIKVQSLAEFDVNFYDNETDWRAGDGKGFEGEAVDVVRF